MGNDTPRVLIRREEAHDTARYHVTNVGENAARLVHLSTNRHKCAKMLLQTTHKKSMLSQKEVVVYVCLLPCVESLGFGK